MSNYTPYKTVDVIDYSDYNLNQYMLIKEAPEDLDYWRLAVPPEVSFTNIG